MKNSGNKVFGANVETRDSYEVVRQNRQGPFRGLEWEARFTQSAGVLKLSLPGSRILCYVKKVFFETALLFSTFFSPSEIEAPGRF